MEKKTECNLHEVLSFIQRKLKAPKGQRNSFGKYNYRSCEDILEAVKPLLPEGVILTLNDELAFTNPSQVVDGEHVISKDRVYIKATARITDGKEAILSTAYAREPRVKKGMDASQITGTASSYARKYALNGLFCIDDAKDADTDEHANQTKKDKPAPKQAPKSSKPKNTNSL